MSHPHQEHQPTSSENQLEIASVGLDHPEGQAKNKPGLSPNKLKQVAEEINNNINNNKEPNWQVETDLDGTKVNVQVD